MSKSKYDFEDVSGQQLITLIKKLIRDRAEFDLKVDPSAEEIAYHQAMARFVFVIADSHDFEDLTDPADIDLVARIKKLWATSSKWEKVTVMED